MNIRRSVNKRLRKAYLWLFKRQAVETISNTSGTARVILPRIPLNFPENKPHVLFIMPFFGADAVSINVNQTIAEFKKQGFIIHVLIYNNSTYEPWSESWDYVYCLRNQTGCFGEAASQRSSAPTVGERAAEHDGLDDWVGDELPMFVAALSRLAPISICVCNFVFLSKSLEFLAPETFRILLTHDVFAERNSKIALATGNSMGFYFSTTEEEEVRGLCRSNLVVAVQEEEANYFAGLIGKEAVCTLPYVPPRRYLPFRSGSSPVVIGFLASSHYPNVDAIRAFVSEFDFSCGALLRIGGSISDVVIDLRNANCVEVLGFVDSLEAFYSGCDIMINPDLLRSGLKVKCVEALSFGKPMIATHAATVGIGVSASYHQAKTVSELARYVEQAVLDKDFLSAVAAESIRVYDQFSSRWTVESGVRLFLSLSDKARCGRASHSLNG